jgi:hypothetical protein
MDNTVLDLSNIYGYERLYCTLLKDNSGWDDSIADMLYNCYIANIAGYNDAKGEVILEPLEKEIFYYRMKTTHREPYITDIQLIKALTLLDWNLSDKPEFANAQRDISTVCSDYSLCFRDEHGYHPKDAITSFSLCEDTLDPEHEPDDNFNPHALVRKYDTGPKLVYICAPLRGDVDANIEFARQKAQEVFAEGNISICPHLMFPPIADPGNPAEDAKAMGMCMKLIDRCNEVRVYGGEWTDGMWKEIRHAENMKIPILTDQKELPRHKAHTKSKPCR